MRSRRSQPPEFQQHSHHQHRRFLPLMGDNFYNCELCGVRIAVLKIVTTANDQEEQFKVCGTCLKQYIDQEDGKKVTFTIRKAHNSNTTALSSRIFHSR